MLNPETWFGVGWGWNCMVSRMGWRVGMEGRSIARLPRIIQQRIMKYRAIKYRIHTMSNSVNTFGVEIDTGIVGFCCMIV